MQSVFKSGISNEERKIERQEERKIFKKKNRKIGEKERNDSKKKD